MNISTRMFAGIAVAGIGAWLTGCSMLGPEAKITMVEAELKATKSVGNVIIASPAVADESGKIDKAVAGTAVKTFGTRARPATAVNTALKAAGAPEGLPDALLAPYLAKFAEAMKDYDPKDPRSRPKEMELPSMEAKGLSKPKKLDGKALKGIMGTLKGEVGTIKAVGGAIAKGDLSGAATALGKSEKLGPLLTRASRALMDKLDADHLLVTHVLGTESDYNSGKEVRMVAALVNVKTGKFRFFGEVAGKKEMGIPYFLFVGNMANSLYGAGADQDPALAEDDGDDEGKKGKKGKSKKKKGA